MFYTFLQKLIEIESRIKKLQRALFYMVNDYNQEQDEGKSSEILSNYNQLLDQIKSETEQYIATQLELDSLVSTAEQETYLLTKQIEDFYQIEIDFDLDEQGESEITSEEFESPDFAQNVFITRDNPCPGQNLETPAIRRSESRLKRHK